MPKHPEPDKPEPDILDPEAPAPRHAGVIAPPPLLHLGALLLGLGLDRLLELPSPGLGQGPRLLTCGALAAAGLALALPAALGFRRAGTQIEPWKPASRLVVAGPYRFTRNPMYLGLALLYLGVALGLGSSGALVLLAPLLLAMHYGVVRREERYLERRFGQAYRDYKARVRRWL